MFYLGPQVTDVEIYWYEKYQFSKAKATSQ